MLHILFIAVTNIAHYDAHGSQYIMHIRDVLGPDDLAQVTALQKEQQIDWKSVPPDGKTVLLEGHEFIVLPGVFPPRFDSSLLINSLNISKGAEILDVGSGSGVLAVYACMAGASRCVALDINADAVRNTQANAQKHGFSDQIDARISDGLAALSSNEQFDFVIANLPGRSLDAKDVVEGAQWDGGYRVHKTFFTSIGKHLKDGGQILMAKANYPEINDLLSFTGKLGFAVKILDKELPSDGDPRTYFTFAFSLPGNTP